MHNSQNCFRIVVMYISVCMGMEICAQNFNPKQIEQERQTFITRQARLCSSDSVVFFKLFNELQNSKRELHKQIKILSKKVPTTNEERRQLVYDIDSLELKMRQLDLEYHEQMFEKLPVKLVYDALKAEDTFRKQTFHRVAKNFKRH